MAPQTQQGEPATVAAGDSWLWTQTFADYPSSEGWTISYVFRGAGALDTTAAMVTYSGTTATVVIPATSTRDLPAGGYTWEAYATGSGSYAGRRHRAGSGVLTVQPNLALDVAGDRQSWAEKTLAVIENVLANKITEDVVSYMIGGRQVMTIPLNELLALKTRLERTVWRERNPGKAFTAHYVTCP